MRSVSNQGTKASEQFTPPNRLCRLSHIETGSPNHVVVWWVEEDHHSASLG